MSTETKPRDDVVTGTETIEGVDLSAEVPCEDPEHELAHAAEIRARFRCDCGSGWSRFLCTGSWLEYGVRMVRCTSCNAIHERDERMWIVEYLR